MADTQNTAVQVSVARVEKTDAIEQKTEAPVAVIEKPEQKLTVEQTANMLMEAIALESAALRSGDVAAVAAINDSAVDIFRNHSVAMPAIIDQSEALEARLAGAIEAMTADPEQAAKLADFRTRWGR